MTAWGRSAGAWPDLVQIVAIPPRPERTGLGRIVGWLLYLFTAAGLGAETGENRPTLVTVRYRGREHSLFKEDSFDSAKEKCETIAREYDAMGRTEWSSRYGVPEEFFS